MAVVVRRGPSAILLVVAIVLSVLAAFGVHTGQFSSLNLAEFGLAFGWASFLV